MSQPLLWSDWDANEMNAGPQLPAGPPPPADWYVDPVRPGTRRYGDGRAWTSHRSEDTPPRGDGPPPPPLAPPPAANRPQMSYWHPEPRTLTALAPSPKQAAVAVVLTLLLPGLGHVYAEDMSSLAIVLLVLSGVMILLSFTLILIPIALLLWIPAAIWGSIDAASSVERWNRARGHPR